jgi:hypothetical protein
VNRLTKTRLVDVNKSTRAIK